METKSILNDKNLEVITLTPDTMGTAAALDDSVFASLQATEPVPKNWEERAQKAWEYFTTEPIVSNVINSWRTFAVGDEIRVTCDDEKIQEEAKELFWKLKLDNWVKDMILQLLVKGDCLGWMRLSKEESTIEEVLCVNPASVKVKYTDGILEKVTQFSEALTGMSTPVDGGVDLPVEQVIHQKWNAPSFSQRGNSLVLPAFQAIELLRAYRKAEQAIAKRWTTPLRFVKVGGKYGEKLIMPTNQMLQTIRDQINRMDLKSGIVVPFYVTAETYGTEGHVLNTELKVKEVKEDIIVALGLARSLVSGDGPNYATANVSMQKMLIMLKEIRQVAKDLLYWVFDRWLALKGHEERKIDFTFSDLDLSNEVEVKRILLELYDRGLISKKTIQGMMELNPEIEDANRKNERLIDVSWEVKDIVSLVQLGIMSVETAQELLGLDREKEAEKAQAGALDDLNRLYSKAAGKVSPELYCDDCASFDEDRNWCQTREEEVTFDQPACTLFDAKPQSAEGKISNTQESSKPSASNKTGCGCKEVS